MEFIENLAEIALIIKIISIVIIIALIVAIISTATNTKNIDRTMDKLENLLEDNLRKQDELLSCLIRMEQQNTKYYNVNYTQLNKIIEQNSRILSEQKEETTI